MSRTVIWVVWSVVVAAQIAHGETITFEWTDTAQIRAYQPNPHIEGFDYWISADQIKSSWAGATLRIDSIQVDTFGDNLGAILNWDMEVHIGGSSIGLPAGQYIKTHADPVSAYTRTAPTQFKVVIGRGTYTTADQDFSVFHDFGTNHTTVTPSYYGTYGIQNSDIDATDGLHAQIYFWTGDNRNSYWQFDGATLTVEATILSAPVPEPTVVVGLLGMMVAGMCVSRPRRGGGGTK